MAFLEEGPDAGDIFIGIGKVRVIPIHPLTETNRLVGDDGGEFFHALDALVGELVQTVSLDVVLGLEAELLLDLDLNPKTLRVKAVAVVGVAALHGMVLNESILEGSAPDVVDTHGVVGGDRAVDEAILRAVCVFLLELVEAVVFLPEGENFLFVFNEGVFGVKFFLHFL